MKAFSFCHFLRSRNKTSSAATSPAANVVLATRSNWKYGRPSILPALYATSAALQSYDAYSTLVYAAGPNDVRTSIIHGRVVMEDRKILTFDVAEVRRQIRRLAEQINARVAQGLH